MKKCWICKELKEESCFYRNKSKRDGLTTECRDCIKIRNKKYNLLHPEEMSKYKRAYYDKNKKEWPAINRKWIQNNPEKSRQISAKYRNSHLEKIRECRNRYEENNREKVKESKRAYRRNNLEKERKRIIQWQKDNPEKSNAKWHRRRARISGNGGSISAKEWLDLVNKYHGMCLCCERNDVKLTLDHIVPVSRGGMNVIDNAQPLCQICNSSKGTKTIDYRIKYD